MSQTDAERAAGTVQMRAVRRGGMLGVRGGRRSRRRSVVERDETGRCRRCHGGHRRRRWGQQHPGRVGH